MKKIDSQTFGKVKLWLRISTAKSTANRFNLHLSTVLNIRGCKNFNEYKEMVKAEHPPIKYSLRDDVLHLHRKFFDTGDGGYHYPRNAQIAMHDLKKVK